MRKIILASGSPRRQELMQIIKDEFEIHTKDTDESFPPGTPPDEVVRMLALRKAKAVAEDYPGDIVIGADTIVALGGRILGKPVDDADAADMLRALSGKRHEVYTGVAIMHPGGEEVFAERTEVEFIPMTERQIAGYVASGEPMDKAGGYGIQGLGALFVRGIAGDFYNVMGLPVCKLAGKLQLFT